MADTNKFCLLEGANPTLAMVVDRFKEIKNFKPQPYWNYKRCIETRFSVMRKGVFEKEDGEILANKVKESEFEIVSVEKRTAMSLHQNYSI
jgi:DNA topoisomerase-3